MTTTLDLIQAPSQEYDDNVLYGSRRYAATLVELAKSGTTSECVMFSIRCPYKKETWDLKRLIQNDRRIKSMLEGAGVTYALPIQRHAWPKLEYSPFPVIFISPASTGKTYTHLIYIVASVIGAIPIAKTEELLFSSDTCGASFKLADSPFLKPKVSETETATKMEEIDHDTFDFNSLGLEDGKSDDQTGWGAKIFEEYEVNPTDFMNHPKYIIVSSSQQQVEMLDQALDKLKLAAFGRDKISLMRVKNLPPVVKKLNVHHDDEKLALRCNSAEVLLTTPAALIRCLQSKYLTLSKCKKLIFEDLDLTLQLHNFNVREIMKLYLAHQFSQATDSDSEENCNEKENQVSNTNGKEPEEICNLFMFSRKWTVLVKQCISTVSLQRTLIFGSIAEAAIYVNVKFELEFYAKNDETKLELLKKHLSYLKLQESIAIVCNEDEEAELVHEALNESGFQVYLCKASGKQSLKRKANYSSELNQPEKVYILSDNTLSVLVDCWPHISRMNGVVHYSMPDDMLAFDQRFRMMYQHIKDESKSLVTVMFINSSINMKLAKELYDLLSRSTVTSNSTKLVLKDLISERYSPICWRWASTGLCRLEKLSRNDRFGSYCPDKHSLSAADRKKDLNSRWPNSGQFKIIIANLISPSEFYFWFDFHRDQDCVGKQWSKLNNTGTETMKELQKELDLLKDIPNCSIPVEEIKQGVVYAIYNQQDTRVDRIVLLEKPKIEVVERHLAPINYDKQYLKQVRVFKIDYGIQLDVFLKNIIQLPTRLQNIESQSHRGVVVGYKPTDGEPNWLYKAKKFFFDQVNVSNLMNITVWLRLNSHRCFWFEDMVVTRLLENIDGFKILKVRPHKELVQAGLATKVTTEPSCLPPSNRLLTLSKWHVSKSAECARYAFLRRDKPLLEVFVLDINKEFELGVRAADYNKLLINLEDQIMEDYRKNKLERLSYFAKDVYCIAKIAFPNPPGNETKEQDITLNRCKILEVVETKIDLDAIDVKENKYLVRCLDHYDEQLINESDLYHAKPEHLSQLPFQAIHSKLANFNQELLKNPDLSLQAREHLYDLTRDTSNDLVRLLCTLNEDGLLELYIPVGRETHEPLGDLFKKKYGIDLIINT